MLKVFSNILSVLFVLVIFITLTTLNYDFTHDNRLELGGLGSDNKNNIYAINTRLQYLLKYNSNGFKLGVAGGRDIGAKSSFDKPISVVVTPQGIIYASDASFDKLHIIDKSLNSIFWANIDFKFNRPTGLALDKLNNLYVVNAGDCNIIKIQLQEVSSVSSNEVSGTVKAIWGKHGNNDGEFITPNSVAIDKQGNLYISDNSLQIIQKFNSEGVFLTKWGSPGREDGQFNSISGLAVNSLGNVYVSESTNNRIQKFDNNGKFLTKWNNGFGEIGYPQAIVTDMDDFIYVLVLGRESNFNTRISKFKSNGELILNWGDFSHTPFFILLFISSTLLFLLLLVPSPELFANHRLK